MTVVGSPGGVPEQTAPPPPPGPGVQPPFAAPPTDGTKQRRWLAVGLTGGAALVLCVGGLVGLGGVVVLATQVIRDQSVAAVEEYLTAIQDREFEDAYNLLCDDIQARTSRGSFVRQQAAEPPISSFTVGEVQLSDQIRVPVTIRYTDQSVDRVNYVMFQNPDTGGVEVCGQED